RGAAGRRAADRRRRAEQRPRRRSACAAHVSRAVARATRRRVRPVAQPRDDGRQSAAAHALSLLHGLDAAVQQARAWKRLPGARRYPRQSCDSRLVGGVRRHAPVGHVGRAGGARRDRRHARAADPARRPSPAAGQGARARHDPRARRADRRRRVAARARPLDLPQSARSRVVRVRARFGRGGSARRGRRGRGGRRRTRRGRAQAVARIAARVRAARGAGEARELRSGSRRGACRGAAPARQRLQGGDRQARDRDCARGAFVSVAERTLIGAPVDRLEGREKVTGAAKYAYEYEAANVVHVVGVAATVPSGRVVRVDAESALKLPGVVAVLWHATAPRLAGDTDPELAIMQSDRVSYRGQWIAAVAAETYAAASAAGRALRIDYEEAEHDSVLTADHPALYTPETVNPGFPSETSQGDVDAALAHADVVVDETYRTPTEHNNAMEPHATLAVWDGDDTLTVYDSNQGVRPVRQALASAFSLDPENVRVISPHVGGGFGSKGTPRPNVILAAMAAKVMGRPAKVAV